MILGVSVQLSLLIEDDGDIVRGAVGVAANHMASLCLQANLNLPPIHSPRWADVAPAWKLKMSQTCEQSTIDIVLTSVVSADSTEDTSSIDLKIAPLFTAMCLGLNGFNCLSKKLNRQMDCV